MIRTLHWYLTRELIRVTLLAVVAFTLVMTIFAIVEPLRREGLSSDQVLGLFGYTIPVMLTLTTPVAALFATTIVYGRFSQDNELLACRASGIATVSVLRPAMELGLVVSIVTLVLSNYVTPVLAGMGEKAVRADLRKISYHQLRSQSYIKRGSLIVHADSVDMEHDQLNGVVVADTKKNQDVRMIVASAARVNFYERDKEWYIGVQFDDPAILQTGRRDIVDSKTVGQEALQVPTNLTKEKISIYSWDQLMRTLSAPFYHPDVQYKLKGINRENSHNRLAQEAAAAINGGGVYDKLTDERDVYRVSAAKATVQNQTVSLSSAPGKRVTVTVLRDGNEAQTVQGDEGEIEARWSPLANTSVVSLYLSDNVTVLLKGEAPSDARRRTEWKAGQLPMPAHIECKDDTATLGALYNLDPNVVSDPSLRAELANFRDKGVAGLVGSVVGEIHSRLAYGTSCFLLVALGAALGLMFRGGQIVSAFAISVVPAALVIVMMIMGKTLLSNPSLPPLAGLASIWSGIAVLLVANLCVYGRLMRK